MNMKMRMFIPSILAILLVVMLVSNTMAAPTISNLTYSPRDGNLDTDYVFTLRYTGDLAPEKVVIVMGDTEYQMEEVDPSDHNFSDSKDYYLITKLPGGSHIWYFKVVSNGTILKSTTYTLIIERFGVGWEHLDVVLAVGVVGGIFIIPVLYIAFIFRRISKNLKEYLDIEKKKDVHLDDLADDIDNIEVTEDR